MAIYLKEFSTHSEYEAYIASEGKVLPNVSICTTEGDVHYNPLTPPTPTETRLVCKYNVEDTSSPTIIANSISNFTEIEIDGVEQPSVVSEYTFSTTGEHTVKYTLTDPTSIGANAFTECSGLTSIDIPNSVTSIGDRAFYECESLTSIGIPSGVTSIGDGAFWWCKSLTSIDIPSGVTSIGESTFESCMSLTSIVIPNSVTSIGNQAFAYCSSLTNINIPDSITSIDDCAFYQCDSLNATARDAIYAINPSAFTCD